MRKVWMLLALLVAAFLTACSSPPPATLEDPDLMALFQAINELRAQGGVCPSGEMPPAPPLELMGPVIAAAQHHAEDLESQEVLTHATPPGSRYYPAGANAMDRITHERCYCRRVAENIAVARDWQQALELWLKSTEGHCEVLFDIDPKTGKRMDLKVVGLGRSGHYWVLDMALP